MNSSPSKTAAQPVAALAFTGFVVDQAHLLDPAEVAKLTDKLDHLQQKTGHQFVVVTISSLGGEDIGSVATKLANRWGVGRKRLDDGIMLLVAPNERMVRIAVGRGLEKELTDPICQQIIDRDVMPQFRRGHIGAGIEAGVAAIVAIVGRDPFLRA